MEKAKAQSARKNHFQLTPELNLKSQEVQKEALLHFFFLAWLHICRDRDFRPSPTVDPLSLRSYVVPQGLLLLLLLREPLLKFPRRRRREEKGKGKKGLWLKGREPRWACFIPS